MRSPTRSWPESGPDGHPAEPWIAHRDLRLANVFLAADGVVWMIDFGFSELAASDLLMATDLASWCCP